MPYTLEQELLIYYLAERKGPCSPWRTQRQENQVE